MSPVVLHTVFETLAYMVGFRSFLWTRRRLAPAAFTDEDHVAWVAVGAIVGAALGAKLSFWLDDPLAAFRDFPNLAHLLEGKSIVGALLGGLAGVELAKKIAGVTHSTGDAFVLPLTLGMCIGRVGCFLAGLNDHTYGNPTALPWGVDFGDGQPRHPTQLYEIVFLLAQYALIHVRRARLTESGDRFRAFLIGYLLFRLLIEFIKPLPYPYLHALSGLQLLCLGGLLYYHRELPRILRALFARRRHAWEPR
jgi:prolipoprotein diacylglyceryltransferase